LDQNTHSLYQNLRVKVANVTLSARVLVITKGHPFDADAFFAMWNTVAPNAWTHWEHPEATELLATNATDDYDVIVFYDMPGIRFTKSDPPAEFTEPPTAFVAAFAALRDAGKPLVFLHHAVAGWPAWEEYAHIVGGRFHYQPATLGTVDYPDSGYRFDVRHTIEVLDPTHPVCEGLGESFSLTDELYLFPVLEAEVVPLMRTTFDMSDASQFYSADLAIRGTRNSNDGWTHPPGSQLVAWAKNSANSPVVYLQFGDGPVTYADSSFQRALTNSLNWVTTTDARQWARDRYLDGPR
jgi:uncharacterized protein